MSNRSRRRRRDIQARVGADGMVRLAPRPLFLPDGHWRAVWRALRRPIIWALLFAASLWLGAALSTCHGPRPAWAQETED